MKEVLDVRAAEMGLPAKIKNDAIKAVSEVIVDRNGKSVFEDMRYSILLKDVDIPILFLHNRADASTPFEFLKKEIDELAKPSIQTKFFDKKEGEESAHVRMFVQYRAEYEATVKEFLTNGK